MRLTSRLAGGMGFIDIKVDEIETTIFGTHEKEVQDLIDNLEQVIEDLKDLQEINIKMYGENSSKNR